MTGSNQYCQERKYFDSGDFALSAANRETDNGAIQTGGAYPHRESISHPYAPIPSSSNVEEDANEDKYRNSASPERSPLLQQTDMKDEPTKQEGQDDHISYKRQERIFTLESETNCILFSWTVRAVKQSKRLWTIAFRFLRLRNTIQSYDIYLL